MPENKQWEYRTLSVGSSLFSIKDNDLEGLLNEWGDEGWEVFSIVSPYGSHKLRVTARRPLTMQVRRARTMPGEEM